MAGETTQDLDVIPMTKAQAQEFWDAYAKAEEAVRAAKIAHEAIKSAYCDARLARDATDKAFGLLEGFAQRVPDPDTMES